MPIMLNSLISIAGEKKPQSYSAESIEPLRGELRDIKFSATFTCLCQHLFNLETVSDIISIKLHFCKSKTNSNYHSHLAPS